MKMLACMLFPVLLFTMVGCHADAEGLIATTLPHAVSSTETGHAGVRNGPSSATHESAPLLDRNESIPRSVVADTSEARAATSPAQQVRKPPLMQVPDIVCTRAPCPRVSYRAAVTAALTNKWRIAEIHIDGRMQTLEVVTGEQSPYLWLKDDGNAELLLLAGRQDGIWRFDETRDTLVLTDSGIESFFVVEKIGQTRLALRAADPAGEFDVAAMTLVRIPQETGSR